MNESSAIERRVVHYTGSVQGVGFRFTTRHIAGRYDVSGFVQNLPDGRVKVVAEGAKPTVEEFLADLAESMRHHIRDVRTETAPGTGEFGGFTVRF